MGENSPEFKIRFGGGLQHAIGILIASYHCNKNGYTFDNPSGLMNRAIYPGNPDVYVKRLETNHDEHGRKRSFWKHYVIEIETHATKASKELKRLQFNTDGGHELLLIDLTELRDDASWVEMDSLIGKRIP